MFADASVRPDGSVAIDPTARLESVPRSGIRVLEQREIRTRRRQMFGSHWPRKLQVDGGSKIDPWLRQLQLPRAPLPRPAMRRRSRTERRHPGHHGNVCGGETVWMAACQHDCSATGRSLIAAIENTAKANAAKISNCAAVEPVISRRQVSQILEAPRRGGRAAGLWCGREPAAQQGVHETGPPRTRNRFGPGRKVRGGDHEMKRPSDSHPAPLLREGGFHG